MGLENEAKKYLKILGYNYNSSEWYEQSYKLINKNYETLKKKDQKKENVIKRIIKKIR